METTRLKQNSYVNDCAIRARHFSGAIDHPTSVPGAFPVPSVPSVPCHRCQALFDPAEFGHFSYRCQARMAQSFVNDFTSAQNLSICKSAVSFKIADAGRLILW